MKLQMKKQKGQALILVLILLLVGGLIIAPLLAFMSTGLRTGQVYENKMMELYSADSGVEDAIWKIKTEDELIPTLPTFPEPKPVHYIVPDINGINVEVWVENLWVLEGLEEPSQRMIIHGMTSHGDWMVLGRSQSEEGIYQVEVTFVTGKGGKKLEKMGVWLPSKFEYVVGSCSDYEENLWLEDPTTQSRGNGTVLIWEYDVVQFEPSGLPQIRTQTFKLMPEEEPTWSLAWIKFQPNDMDLAWDGELGIYKVTSVANGTTIESYVIKYNEEMFINTWEIQ